MPKRLPTPKEATSFRLTPEAKRLLEALAEKNGLSLSACMETIIRKEARREKISLELAAGAGNDRNGRE
jgi:predicted transcriptional regulator